MWTGAGAAGSTLQTASCSLSGTRQAARRFVIPGRAAGADRGGPGRRGGREAGGDRRISAGPGARASSRRYRASGVVGSLGGGGTPSPAFAPERGRGDDARAGVAAFRDARALWSVAGGACPSVRPQPELGEPASRRGARAPGDRAGVHSSRPDRAPRCGEVPGALGAGQPGAVRVLGARHRAQSPVESGGRAAVYRLAGCRAGGAGAVGHGPRSFLANAKRGGGVAQGREPEHGCAERRGADCGGLPPGPAPPSRGRGRRVHAEGARGRAVRARGCAHRDRTAEQTVRGVDGS